MRERPYADHLRRKRVTSSSVVVSPAKAGVQVAQRRWIPVFTGMTAMGPHSFHGNGGDGPVACFNVATSLSAANGLLCSQCEVSCVTLPNRFCAARFTRGTLTPARSLEGEGVPERIQRSRKDSVWVGVTREPEAKETRRRRCRCQSLRVVIEHLAELLFGHARRAEQNQDDFRLEGLGLGKGRAGGLAHTRMNRRRLRDRDYRHGFAFGEIGDDPGWEQPAELRQGLFHGLSVRHPVVEGYRNRASSSLAVPGNSRQAVRHIGHVNSDVVQGEGVGGRVFLRQVHLRRHREVGNHGVNGFPLYDAAGESRQVRPVAAGLRRRDDDGERRSGGRGSV